VEFFWTGHGKGPHDGVGAILKRFFKKSRLGVKWAKVAKCGGCGHPYVHSFVFTT
jgi:hypothetical protein